MSLRRQKIHEKTFMAIEWITLHSFEIMFVSLSTERHKLWGLNAAVRSMLYVRWELFRSIRCAVNNVWCQVVIYRNFYIHYSLELEI